MRIEGGVGMGMGVESASSKNIQQQHTIVKRSDIDDNYSKNHISSDELGVRKGYYSTGMPARALEQKGIVAY